MDIKDKKSIRRFLIIKEREKKGNAVKYKIALLVNDLTLVEWWKETIFFNLTEIVPFMKMMNDPDDDISKLYENKNVAELYESFSKNGALVADYVEIIKSLCKAVHYPYKNDLSLFKKEKLGDLITEKIWSGKRFRKIDKDSIDNITKLWVWFYFKAHAMIIIRENLLIDRYRYDNNKIFRICRHIFKKMLRINSPLANQKNINRAYDHFNKGQELMDLMNKSMTVSKSPDGKRYIIKQRSSSEEDRIILEKIKIYADEDIRMVNERMDSDTNSLFLLLNTSLLPVQLRTTMAEIIIRSIFRKAIQRKYDSFCYLHGDAIPLRFYLLNKRNINKVLDEQFDKNDYGHSGLRLNLSRGSIEKLYSSLILKGYLNSETDINNFAFALTSKPKRQEDFFIKVDWIGDKKQSLAVFLGLLKMLKTPDAGWYWNRSPELFLFKGKPFKPSQLSTPFGNMISHPETRKKEWDELEDIIKSSEMA